MEEFSNTCEVRVVRHLTITCDVEDGRPSLCAWVDDEIQDGFDYTPYEDRLASGESRDVVVAALKRAIKRQL